jgi:hypothetical protein
MSVWFTGYFRPTTTFERSTLAGHTGRGAYASALTMAPPAVRANAAAEPMTSRHAEQLVRAATGDTTLSFGPTAGRVPAFVASESDGTVPPNPLLVVPLPPPLPPERGERDEPHYVYEVNGADDPGVRRTPSGKVGGGRAERIQSSSQQRARFQPPPPALLLLD